MSALSKLLLLTGSQLAGSVGKDVFVAVGGGGEGTTSVFVGLGVIFCVGEEAGFEVAVRVAVCVGVIGWVPGGKVGARVLVHVTVGLTREVMVEVGVRVVLVAVGECSSVDVLDAPGLGLGSCGRKGVTEGGALKFVSPVWCIGSSTLLLVSSGRISTGGESWICGTGFGGFSLSGSKPREARGSVQPALRKGINSVSAKSRPRIRRRSIRIRTTFQVYRLNLPGRKVNLIMALRERSPNREVVPMEGCFLSFVNNNAGEFGSPACVVSYVI